jgi:hypothetical protein
MFDFFKRCCKCCYDWEEKSEEKISIVRSSEELSVPPTKPERKVRDGNGSELPIHTYFWNNFCTEYGFPPEQLESNRRKQLKPKLAFIEDGDN